VLLNTPQLSGVQRWELGPDPALASAHTLELDAAILAEKEQPFRREHIMHSLEDAGLVSRWNV